MTAGRRYLAGLAGVVALGGCMVGLTRPELRHQVAWAATVGFLVQAPLGWLLVQSIGTERFMVVWGVGMIARLAVLGVAGMVVVPMLGWSTGPALGALVAVLVTLLFVEGITAWQEHSGQGDGR